MERDWIWPRPDGLPEIGTDRADATAVEGIDREVDVDAAEELDGVVSKGIGSRFRDVKPEYGIVRDLAGDNDRELVDGGGKKESCDTGMRRIV